MCAKNTVMRPWYRVRLPASTRRALSSSADALAAMRSRAAQAAARSGFVDRQALLPSGEPLTFLERPPVRGGTPSSVVVFLHGMMHAHLAFCARNCVLYSLTYAPATHIRRLQE